MSVKNEHTFTKGKDEDFPADYLMQMRNSMGHPAEGELQIQAYLGKYPSQYYEVFKEVNRKFLIEIFKIVEEHKGGFEFADMNLLICSKALVVHNYRLFKGNMR